MEFFENIPFVIFIIVVACFFTWQWRKTRKLHNEFMEKPKNQRKKEEAQLYFDPVKNAYVRSMPIGFVLVIVIFMILLFVGLGIRMSETIR